MILCAAGPNGPMRGLNSATLIGDALAPATIAHAVYEGRRYAEQLGETVDPDVVPFRREVAGLAAWIECPLLAERCLEGLRL